MRPTKILAAGAVWPALTALLGLTLAALAFGNAMGNLLAVRNPRLALRFDVSNSSALAGAATLALANQAAGKGGAGNGRDLARSAVRQGPVEGSAMRALAIATSLTGDTKTSLQELEIAQAMSRRDLATQVALIEACVTRRQIKCALTHYDVALTTSATNAAPLFPVLSAATTDPAIIRAVAPYIRRHRPWAASFMTYVAQQADPVAAASLVIASGRLPGDMTNQESEGVIFGRLAADGRWEVLKQMYRSVEGERIVRATEIGFNNRTIDPQRIPVAWQPISSGSVSASFEPAAQASFVLRLDVAGDGAGDVEAARRVLFLPQGAHVMMVHVGDVAMARGSALALLLRCLSSGDPAGRDVATWRLMPPSGGAHFWRFVIPGSCPAQSLSILVRGATEPADGTITIDRMALVPEATALSTSAGR